MITVACNQFHLRRRFLVIRNLPVRPRCRRAIIRRHTDVVTVFRKIRAHIHIALHGKPIRIVRRKRAPPRISPAHKVIPRIHRSNSLRPRAIRVRTRTERYPPVLGSRQADAALSQSKMRPKNAVAHCGKPVRIFR
ncbi:hypothetical protein Barb6_02381 [Bacteroidales bacterium Barb6]|nr:hypothetical protein Barb6_02381 [Bacteroidales bacterium Barb6]